METTSLQYRYVHALPQEQIEIHTQETWELSCVLIGVGMRIIGDGMEPFSVGDTVLIPPGIPHCWYFDATKCDANGRIASVSIMFSDKLIDGMATTFPECRDIPKLFEDKSRCTVFTGKTAKEIQRILTEMNNRTAIARLASFIRLLPLIGGGTKTLPYSRTSNSIRRNQQIETYVLCNLSSNLTLDHLATHLCMNRSSVCVLFRRHFGVTFTEYVNRLRIAKAKQLLLQSSAGIQSIGYEVGFNTISHFNHTFRNIEGCTPSEFRRKR